MKPRHLLSTAPNERITSSPVSAGLLALIEVDLTKLSARLTLGRRTSVDLGGRDIPSGSVACYRGRAGIDRRRSAAVQQ